jgi:hypothetical protein
MGVNLPIDLSTNRLSFGQIRKHPIGFLRMIMMKEFAQISKRINPFIVITDDGTRGANLIVGLLNLFILPFFDDFILRGS